MLEQTKYYDLWCRRTTVKESTLKVYQSQLEIFDEFLVREKGVEEGELDFDKFYVDEESGLYYPIDKYLIEEFVEYLSEHYQDKSPTVPQNTFTAVKNFFRTLHRNGLIEKDPTKNAIGPAYYHSQRRISLIHSELQDLLDAAYRKDPFTQMYAVLVLLLAHGGLRNQELRFLTFDRIRLQEGYVIIDQGQKTSPGTIHMSPLLQTTLTHFLNHPFTQTRVAQNSGTTVFVNTSGKRMWARELIEIVGDLASEANITKHVTPHVLRHTSATELYRAGIDLSLTRRHMRHSLGNTTLIYVNPMMSEDRDALENSRGTAILKTVIEKYRPNLLRE